MASPTSRLAVPRFIFLTEMEDLVYVNRGNAMGVNPDFVRNRPSMHAIAELLK